MKKFLLLVALTLCLSTLFVPCFVAHAEDLSFTLNTNGYESGTWSAQEVTVDIEYWGQTEVEYEISVADQNSWRKIDGPTYVFEHGFNNNVWFRLITSKPSYSLMQMLNIKVDTQAPEIELVMLSNVMPTNQDIVLTILAKDNDSGVVEYKLGSSQWQTQNFFVISSNQTFDIGDIRVRDRAGNESVYNQQVKITNIDKTPPAFNVVAQTNQTASSALITIDVHTAYSGVKQVLITTPNGKQQDITQTYQNGFLAKKNGEYRITVISVAGNQSSKIIVFSNLTGPVATWQKIIIYFCFFAIGTFAAINAVNLTIKRKNKNKKNKLKI
jgi:hypothetical protein